MELPQEALILVRKEAKLAAHEEVQHSMAELRDKITYLENRLRDLDACTSSLLIGSDGAKDVDPRTTVLSSRKEAPNADYAVLPQDTAALLQDPEQNAPGEGSRPESLFCYCAFELAAVAVETGHQAVLRRAKLCAMLVLLVTVEFLLATALFEASILSLYKEMWAPPGSQGPSNTCFYTHPTHGPIPTLFGSKILAGKPRIEWVVAAFCYLVVLLTVKADDRQLLAASQPIGMALVYRVLFFLMWCMRSLYRCAWIGSATVLLLADTSDMASIIMNSVAVTFLLEIDDLAYSAGLSADAQERYQQSSACTKGSCQLHQVEFFSWCFFTLHGVTMAGLYLLVVFFEESAPHTLRANMLIGFPIFLMVGRSLLFFIASERVTDHPHRIGYVMSILAKTLLGFGVAVACGLPPWILLGFDSDPKPDFNRLQSCLDGSNSTACLC